MKVSWKRTIIHFLFVILMVAKTVILVNLVKKYCIDWGYIVGQLDVFTTVIISHYMARWLILCTVK